MASHASQGVAAGGADACLYTVEAPLYWEQWEPTPGHFDPSNQYERLKQAREHQVHPVLLWFGTWKNGSGDYTPSYIKLDETGVPHVNGKSGGKVDSLSPRSEYVIDEDKKAFRTLMYELNVAEQQEHFADGTGRK